MRVVHLTSSTFFGGPERQMLGLTEALPAGVSSTILSFSENGRCREFLDKARERGHRAEALAFDSPKLLSAYRELRERIQGTDILLCHGYKANLIGRAAAHANGIPAIAISRGWTGENAKVKLYERIDKFHLRFMDRVVAVSEGQAAKVRALSIPDSRLSVIRNSSRLASFGTPDPVGREELLQLFDGTVSRFVVSAGRLSPEKGFDLFVRMAGSLSAQYPDVGFVLYGEGNEREKLEKLVQEQNLTSRFRMPGFARDLDRKLPWCEALVLSSHTEGLPNVILEASAAGIPSVATAVGGTPEVIAEGVTGFLVPAGDVNRLSQRLDQLLGDATLRKSMGAAARRRMEELFSFSAQARSYVTLFHELLAPRGAPVIA